jgi:hypothetical protein
MFRLYNESGKKETATSENLLRALERCDELDYEIGKLREEIAEYHSHDVDF